MSALMNQARNRVPRFAEAAVEHARLTVVPRRHTRAARVPFMVLVSLLLVGGVTGLLAFNTSMQQASFTATSLQERATVLNAEQQSLQMSLERLRDPQRLAVRARAMGLVPAPSPAFLRLSDGKILGAPAPALVTDGIRVQPLPTQKPLSLRPPAVTVPSKQAPTAHAGSSHAGNGPAATGAASPAPASGAGTKNTHSGYQHTGRTGETH
ncbi:MAG: hypothetical protein ACXVXE_05135 [Nocardioidaceae bacterium]